MRVRELELLDRTGDLLHLVTEHRAGAKRNEFGHQGRTFIGYGGTMGAKAPLSEAARRDQSRLYGENPDYLHGKTLEQKLTLLARISYQELLLMHEMMGPDALPLTGRPIMCRSCDAGDLIGGSRGNPGGYD